MAAQAGVMTWRSMEDIRGHSNSLITLGVLEMAAGILLLITPFLTTLTITLLMGLAVAISGLLQILGVIGQSRWWTRRLIGIVTLAAGILIIAHPLLGLNFLTLLIAAYFAAIGVFRIVAGSQIRATGGEAGWLIFGGSLSLILAVIVFIGWPATSAAFLGLLVAIQVLFSGMTNMSLGMEAKKIERQEPAFARGERK